MWFYLHDGVEPGLEAAQMLLLHLDALRNLLLRSLRLTVLHRQPLHKETHVAFLLVTVLVTVHSGQCR